MVYPLGQFDYPSDPRLRALVERTYSTLHAARGASGSLLNRIYEAVSGAIFEAHAVAAPFTECEWTKATAIWLTALRQVGAPDRPWHYAMALAAHRAQSVLLPERSPFVSIRLYGPEGRIEVIPRSSLMNVMGWSRQQYDDLLVANSDRGVDAIDMGAECLPEAFDALVRLVAFGPPAQPFAPQALTELFLLGDRWGAPVLQRIAVAQCQQLLADPTEDDRAAAISIIGANEAITNSMDLLSLRDALCRVPRFETRLHHLVGKGDPRQERQKALGALSTEGFFAFFRLLRGEVECALLPLPLRVELFHFAHKQRALPFMDALLDVTRQKVLGLDPAAPEELRAMMAAAFSRGSLQSTGLSEYLRFIRMSDPALRAQLIHDCLERPSDGQRDASLMHDTALSMELCMSSIEVIHELRALLGESSIVASGMSCYSIARTVCAAPDAGLHEMQQTIARRLLEEQLREYGNWQSKGNIKEARSRIQEAIRTQTSVLDLRGLGLTSLPTAIGAMNQLRLLRIDGNQITSLPASLGDIPDCRVYTTTDVAPMVLEGDTPAAQAEQIAARFAAIRTPVECALMLYALPSLSDETTAALQALFVDGRAHLGSDDALFLVEAFRHGGLNGALWLQHAVVAQCSRLLAQPPAHMKETIASLRLLGRAQKPVIDCAPLLPFYYRHTVRDAESAIEALCSAATCAECTALAGILETRYMLRPLLRDLHSAFERGSLDTDMRTRLQRLAALSRASQRDPTMPWPYAYRCCKEAFWNLKLTVNTGSAVVSYEALDELYGFGKAISKPHGISHGVVEVHPENYTRGANYMQLPLDLSEGEFAAFVRFVTGEVDFAALEPSHAVRFLTLFPETVGPSINGFASVELHPASTPSLVGLVTQCFLENENPSSFFETVIWPALARGPYARCGLQLSQFLRFSRGYESTQRAQLLHNMIRYQEGRQGYKAALYEICFADAATLRELQRLANAPPSESDLYHSGNEHAVSALNTMCAATESERLQACQQVAMTLCDRRDETFPMVRSVSFDEAVRRIREAAGNNATMLDLRGLELTQIPEAIGALSNLRALHIENNNLTSLPPSLADLRDCDIYVGGNPLAPIAVGLLQYAINHTSPQDAVAARIVT